MDTMLLKTVGQIAGIGGLGLGVLLLTFREVVRKNIFPGLTKVHGYRIIRLIVVTTFLIAAFGITAWTYVQTSVQTRPNGSGEMPVTERERHLADQFWSSAYAREWKSAYDVFPAVLHAQMPFAKFVNAASYALGQFARPPISRDFEAADAASGTMIMSTLARFDDASVFRELLTFQLQNGQWVPWSFVVNPVEWPRANEYVFISERPIELLTAARHTPPAERIHSMAQRFAGKYVGPPGWPLRVESIGGKTAGRTCDVNAVDSATNARVVLTKVLDGCSLDDGSLIQVVGQVASVSEACVSIQAVRLWK